MLRFVALVVLALVASCDGPPAFAATSQPLSATVVRVIDGDTVRVAIPAWVGTPFAEVSVRIAGIDTPEADRGHARCAREVVKGKAAQAFARTLVNPGDAVTVIYQGLDKYARIDGSLTLLDGRDWARIMLSNGYAKPYAGGTKPKWC